MVILYIILFLLLIGFLSSIEITFLSANKIGIKKKQEKSSTKLLAYYLDHVSLYRGGHLFGTLLGMAGLSIVSLQLFQNILLNVHPVVPFIVAFVFSFLAVLFLGEILPKNIFKSLGDKSLSALQVPIRFFHFLFAGLAQSFKKFANFLLKYLFNLKTDNTKKLFDRIDIEHFERQLKTGKDDGAQDVNTELFENALELSNIRIRECLIPRNEILGVEVDTPIQEIKQKFIDSKHSKLLVYQNDLDNIVGYLHHLDFYKEQLALKDLVHKIPVVPEAMHAVELLNKFTKNRKSIAWVVDEFGGTAGIVTMEDLLEEIFGEIEDEHDESEYIEKQISKNEFILSGRLEVEYINEKFGLEIPTENSETLSGYIVEEHNAIPKQNDKIILGNYAFDILLVNKTRIETVKLIVLDNED